jgi:PAS domain S-box-containing protein
MADAPRAVVDQRGLQVLLGQLNDAVAFVDRDGAILLTNRAEELPAARATLRMADLGQAFEIFHPDGRRYETAEWPVVRSIRTGEAISGEEFYRRARDGSRRSFSCNSAPIHDENGRLAGAVLVTRDVSRRKRAQEQLAYLLPMLDQTEDAIIAFDPHWRVTAWNQGAERMYGWSAEEALRRELRSFMTTSMSDAQTAEIRCEVAERGRWRGEVDVERRDGSMLSVESTNVAIRGVDSQITGYLAIHRDVTDRKGSAAMLVSAAREQTLLTDISLRALSGDALQALLDDAVGLIADVLHVELCAIAELEPAGERLSWRAGFGWSADEIAGAAPCPAGTGSLVGYTILVGEPVISDDAAADGRFRVSSLLAQRAPASAAAVVIPGQHDPYGVLAVVARQPRTFGSREIEFVQTVANVIGIAVERAAVDDRLDAARQSERARIARELHDGGLRELTDALSIATLARSGAADPQDKERWAELIASLAGLGRQLRGAIYDLRLGTHDDRMFPGLLGELVEVQAAMAGDCRVELAGHELLPGGSLGRRGTQVLWVVREAITNARRHSGATLIRVDAGGSTGQLLRLVIRDDGRWPDRESVLSSRPGAGITGMRERADLVGATLTFASGAQAGTEVSLELALPGSGPNP